MAGSTNVGEESDNPVGINVTAMVDVIFCLCLFFMCSFHFKRLEGKIETWLPKDSGAVAGSATPKNLLDEIRVSLDWDQKGERTMRRAGQRPPASSDTELMSVVVQMRAQHLQAGDKDPPIVLAVARQVPWNDVVHVMDLCKREKMERIEFSAPAK